MTLSKNPARTLRNARLDRRQFAAGAAVSAAVAVAGVSSVHAQDATPAAGSPPAGGGPAPVLPAGVEVSTVASGLQSPRFVAISQGTVYFTEAGTGGDTAVIATPGAGTPESTEPISMNGKSGKLSSIAGDGTVTVLVDDFMSYTFGENGEIVGPAGVAVDGNGKAYVAVGSPGPLIASIDLTGEEGVVYEVDLATKEKKILANAVKYEIEKNPDPMAIDSNIYGVAYDNGTIYVADAGGNDILAVKADSGDISTFAVTGGLDVNIFPPSGNPARQGEQQIDSVPSDVAIGPDGNIYVSFVTGGPFPPGLAPIYSYAPDGTKSVFATGLTMTGSLAFASDGTLYASIISTNLLQMGLGQIVRVKADGAHEVIIDGLIAPNGIAFDDGDNLFVAVKTTGAPGGGEILKFTGVTSAAGQPAATPSAATPEVPAVATPIAAAAPVTILCEDIKYSTNAVSIPADTDVAFTIQNAGVLPHDFQIDKLKVSSGLLASGKSANLVINAPAGTYTYYCGQPGHRAAGMVGTLTVE